MSPVRRPTLRWCRGHKTAGAQAPTSVTLFDQGLIDVLEASVTGLQPMQPYVLALSDNADGRLVPLIQPEDGPVVAHMRHR